MNFRLLRFLPLPAVAAISIALGGCTLFEPGSPPAAITVHAHSAFQALDATEQVFNDDGWHTSGRTLDSISFEKNGTKTDQVMYGNWIEGEVKQRAHITVAELGDGSFRLRCLPSVARDPNDVSFEDEHRRVQVFSFHYTHMLRDVKRVLDEAKTSQNAPPPD